MVKKDLKQKVVKQSSIKNHHQCRWSSICNQAGGGVAFGKVTSNNQIFDYDLLASKISESNRTLPSPVVAVDEINRVTTNVSVIETTASL